MTKAKIVSAALTASTALLSIAPAAFATTVEVSNNGGSSDNTVNLELNRVVTLQQQNTANVDNTVKANGDTGNNQANANTGGDVSIKTGDATAKVAVGNNANSNGSTYTCCDPLSVEAKIAGNGAYSNSQINLSLTDIKNIYDINNLDINNDIDADANTGGNEANGNTDGDVEISTGNALIEIVLTNKGNSNHAEIDCCKGDEDGEELPLLPGTVEAIPAAAAPAGKTLPMTGFDFQIIVAGSAVMTTAGALLRKGSQKLS